MPTFNPHPDLVRAIRQQPRHLQIPLLTTTLIESGGRLDAVGDGGRSHGPFQEYDLGRGSGIPIAGRRDPFAATARAAREFEVFYGRGARGGDLAFRAQRPADRGNYLSKYAQFEAEARRILGAGGPAAQQVPARADHSAVAAEVGAAPASRPFTFVITPRLQRQIDAYLIGSRQDVLAGRTPRDALGVVQGISRSMAAQRQAHEAAAPAPRTMSHQHGHFDGDGHDHGPAATGPLTSYDASRYPTGPVDSGRVHRGGEGGNWGGSLERALFAAQASGLPVTSQKRSRQRTASGGVSDHWVGSTRSYAVDLGTSGSAGDQAYVKLLRGLGLDPGKYRSGTWHNINIGGYRYQIGWRTPGHFDHIHVGVQRL